MAVTTWRGGSGDWNDPAEWTNGVPTASDEAVFPGVNTLPLTTALPVPQTVTGGGVAASITVQPSEYPTNSLELTGAQGAAPVRLATGTLLLDPGAAVGPIDAALDTNATVGVADGDHMVFSGHQPLRFLNGSGHATVLGAVGDASPPDVLGLDRFGGLEVFGGTGSVTVFGADAGGSIFGGTAGGNILVGGAVLDAYLVIGGIGRDDLLYQSPAGIDVFSPGGVTIGGGGEGDLLVATGGLDDVLAASGGNETLTGAAASGDDTLFGGSGADLIVAGSGRDVVVAGSGAATIVAGSGADAIFAGAGGGVILGGAGEAYVRVGSGAAELFTGAGAALIGVEAGQSGGRLVVHGFRAGVDRIAAQGFAAAPSVAAGSGGVVLTFADRTQVTLLGVASLPGGVFA